MLTKTAEEFREIAREEARKVFEKETEPSFRKLLQKLAPILKKMGYEEQLIDSKEACEFLGISLSTLFRYRERRGLPLASKNPVRFRKSELAAWQKKQKKRISPNVQAFQDPLEREVASILASVSN